MKVKYIVNNKIEYKKGDILYYYYNYRPGEYIVIEIVVDEDYSGNHGLAALFKINKIIIEGSGRYFSNRNTRVKEGKTISANELDGVSFSGVRDYVFTSKKLVKRIFESEI